MRNPTHLDFGARVYEYVSILNCGIENLVQQLVCVFEQRLALTGHLRHTQEEVQKIIDELDYQLKHLKERFSGKRAFSLSSSEEPDEQ